MSAPDYGRAFALWRTAAPDWQAYTHHGFVEGLRRGELPRAAFLHYLRQDYVFLIHFARAWALAAAKADTLAEMQAASATVHALVHHEMPLHVQICAGEGINAAALEATLEAPETLAYTRYVLEAGYSGDSLDLMAALAPCVLGYGEIGARLAGSGGPYAGWIDTYGGAEYQALCRDVGALIDGALDHRLGTDWARVPRFARLTGRFATATRLEVGFWQMGLLGHEDPCAT
ncbi:TenA family protein [Roseicitreum antarcticum]|uniref:Thiaminase (Transcriptional activator TenA) n=1 Tax=Roseicitreum antarcticum TaxID=564137 RepID=A0A1H2YM12_9RHOB|nr:TenA family protein [Roseicitreum antarcticum]SDX06120.1 thiaminase (transcriptional activator TenA) [Roseicitreum antarcticum]